VHCDGSTSWAALTSCEHFFPAWQGAWQTSVKLADLRMPVSMTDGVASIATFASR
jgi:hypothetical protein